MYTGPTPLQRLAERVDGARMVRYDEHTRRVFVWRTGPVIDVVSVDTCEVLGNWPCDETVESADVAVTERLRAGY